MEKGRVLERKVFYAGQKVFNEGEAGDRAYLIQEGTVEITKHGLTLATLGKGELFGEMALVDDQPRMASAKAQTDLSVVIISRDAFREKLSKADPFIRGLINIFVRNIRNLTR
ncbi:cyclic nucleotide-binding domain-containing protein [Magnetospirillum sp. UT-4]|uniref:cyclic nucleotide-binding domain-containing protein n=1 Tax=Magnetospirillum sp. UT-4 TaxID=2681467 RepID=UPI0013834AA8|nr:cyclic nucleotide-binding domain-containing protein [Magnetospirillum sp. UT-4]CAA7624462.1 cAMP-binding protein-catabolite gene activator and regulatory subunit of cAMP-dependent protein kinase [Magnetospirillum sp. UT-4]